MFNWEKANAEHPAALVSYLHALVHDYDSFAKTADQIAEEVGCRPDEAENMLKELAKQGFINAEARVRCPDCKGPLDGDLAAGIECSVCHVTYNHNKKPPEQYTVYSKAGEQGRDVRWVLTVHGMNTRGAWQEEYTWRLAQLYGYAIPTAIYKYGNIKVSPFIPCRRRYYTSRLINSLKTYSAGSTDNGYGGCPDVVAHSFGTWLLYQALQEDSGIKVGRVILTGSIVSPDCDWKKLIDQGRVNAVLCHHAKKDFVCRLAQFGISRSGPSGYCGFVDRTNIVHHFESGFGHSDFFSPTNLEDVMKHVWGPFLQTPNTRLSTLSEVDCPVSVRTWHPSRLAPLTRLLKNVLLVLGLLLSVFLLLSLVLGVRDAYELLAGCLR